MAKSALIQTLVIILIALALRLYNLSYHSFWFDEAVSVHWARQSVPRILEVGFTLVEDRLPPLYYLTLKGWTALFGFSEAGIRCRTDADEVGCDRIPMLPAKRLRTVSLIDLIYEQPVRGCRHPDR